MRNRFYRLSLAAVAAALVASACRATADVVISSDATQNMSCSAGVCAPTATDAVLNVTDLENLLASGNVEVTTTGSGVQATNIDVTAALAWPDASTLALVAYQSITFTGAVSIIGTGGLSLTKGSGGTLLFGTGGSASFQNLSSPLTINGAGYTLVNGVAAMATAIAANPAGNFALANNYDASGDGTYSNSPVTTPVQGTIEGLGNAISNLSIVPTRRKISAALIGEVFGTVENLQLQQIHYRCRRSACNFAGLVFYNEGNLFNDLVSGSIETENGDGGGLVWENNGEYGASIISSFANVRINAKQGNAGGLAVVSSSGGTIELSRATGDLVASLDVGGLVGWNSGTITESFATGSASGGNTTGAGGLIAVDNGYVENSYSRGAVSSAGLAGGFVGSVGSNGGFEFYSYSTGKVSLGGFACYNSGGIFRDDYWNKTTSGTKQATCDGASQGISGRTSKALKSGLPVGFSSSIWSEDSNTNNGFPYLIANPPAQ